MTSQNDNMPSADSHSQDPVKRPDDEFTPLAIEPQTRCLVCDDLLVEPPPETDEEEEAILLGIAPPSDRRVCRGCGRYWHINAVEFRPPADVERNNSIICRFVGVVLLIVAPTTFGLLWPKLAALIPEDVQVSRKVPVYFSMCVAGCAMFAGLLLIVRKPVIALASSAGLVWRRWSMDFEEKDWLDISRIDFDAESNTIAVVDTAGQRLRAVEKIIRQSRQPDELPRAVHELRRHWGASIDAHTENFSKEHGIPICNDHRMHLLRQAGRPRRCPTCRRDLTRTTLHAVKCQICASAGDAGTRIYRYPGKAATPTMLMSFFTILCVSLLAYLCIREAGLSFGVAATTALGIVSIAPIIYAIHRWFDRRAPRFVMDREAIMWTASGRRVIRLPWRDVDAVLGGADCDRTYIRLNDGDIVPVPMEFIPKGFTAIDFAAMTEKAREEYLRKTIEP